MTAPTLAGRAGTRATGDPQRDSRHLAVAVAGKQRQIRRLDFIEPAPSRAPFTVDPVPAPGAAPVAFRDEFDGCRIKRGLRYPSGCPAPGA
jgi:hypothetical protein